jgi:hypothetical protein
MGKYRLFNIDELKKKKSKFAATKLHLNICHIHSEIFRVVQN